MKTITLDLDDFSVENNNMFYIDKLKEQYPDFKISMFYIPADMGYYGRLMPELKEVAKKSIKKAVKEGWMELIPHGLMHATGEFQNADYKTMEMTLAAYKEHFKDFGVPYVKGFKAPNWLMSSEAIRCLDDNGWFLATDRNQPKSLKAKKNYVYNWDIAESFPNLKVVKGHGHISGPSVNDFTQWFINLTQIPADYTWKFVSEIV